MKLSRRIIIATSGLAISAGCHRKGESWPSSGAQPLSENQNASQALAKDGVKLRTDLDSLERALAGIASKDEITIVYTDSGVGGMSVLARDIGRLYNQKSQSKVRFVFANAIFSQDVAFSSLTDQKLASIFSRFLTSIDKRYQPDLIVVACNTLSVLVPLTDFHKAEGTPILDIAATSVNLMDDTLAQGEKPSVRKTAVYMFATPVTVRNAMYKDELLRRGRRPEAFVDVPCSGLVGRIETDPTSASTRERVQECVDVGLARRPAGADEDVYVSLNCTHFPYAKELWIEAFAKRGVQLKGILNPNESMTAFLHRDTSRHGKFPSTETTAEVVTMMPFRSGVKSSIAGIIEQTWSPKAAVALRNAKVEPDLFPWRDLLPEPQD
jgi:glutamate racemase